MLTITRTVVGLVIGWLGARVLALLARLHVAPSRETKRTTRRGFVRNATLGAVGVVLVEAGIGFYEFFYPNKTGAFGQTITVAKGDVPKVEGTPFTDVPGKFYLVHNQDGVLALYWRCVHLGCTVPWNASEHQFHCPCHGSIYNYNGVRTGGPAPRPLDIMAVKVTPTGDVQVNTGKITQRSSYEKSQAAPYSA